MEIAKLEVGAGPPLSLEIDGSFIGEINVPANGIITTRLAPGRHQLKLYRIGYRTVTIEVSPGNFHKIDFQALENQSSMADTFISPQIKILPTLKTPLKRSIFTLRAGLTLSNYWIKVGKSSNKPGLFFGISYRYPVWKAISFQSGIGYVWESVDYNYAVPNNNWHFKQIDEWYFIQVPLLARIDLAIDDESTIFISSGICPNFFLYSRTHGNISETGFDYNYSNIDGLNDKFPDVGHIEFIFSTGIKYKKYSIEFSVNNGNRHSRNLVPQYYLLGGDQYDIDFNLRTIKLFMSYDL
jgi:hypothetical protein